MRIFHVISGLDGGGAEAILYRLCTISPGRSDDVVVSLTTDDVYGDRLRAAGITVHALRMPRGIGAIAGTIKLRRLIREAQPDLVQTWLYHGDLVGGIAARLAGIRNVVWGLHNSTIDQKTTRWSTRQVVRYCAFVSSFVPARIISCSSGGAAVHVAIGYPADRITVVPNGYDLGTFRPDAAARAAFRRQIGVADDELLVGMVARYDPQKDPNNLLDAMASLARDGIRFRGVLVGRSMNSGNAPLMAALKARNLDGRVILLGARNDIPTVMAAIDVGVLSSAYGEAFPNVIAEAMACGTPVVTTDVGDAAFIVGDTGWIVPPRDSAALARAIGQALAGLADRSEWAARQAASRNRIVGNFAIDRMIAGYEGVWRQVVERAA